MLYQLSHVRMPVRDTSGRPPDLSGGCVRTLSDPGATTNSEPGLREKIYPTNGFWPLCPRRHHASRAGAEALQAVLYRLSNRGGRSGGAHLSRRLLGHEQSPRRPRGRRTGPGGRLRSRRRAGGFVRGLSRSVTGAPDREVKGLLRLADQVVELGLDVDEVGLVAGRHDRVGPLEEVGDLVDRRLEVGLAER